MELICITDIDDFLGLKDEWNNLLSLSENNSLFLRHEWLSTWWMSYGSQKELQILLVKHNNRLIAAAPLMIAKDNKWGIPLRRIAFMGDSEWTVNDFIILEQKRKVIEMVIESLLRNEWDVVDLRNMPAESDHISITSEVLRARSFSFSHAEAAHSPVLMVSGSWDDFYNSRSTKFKKTIRNKINRINKSGIITIQRYSLHAEVSQILPAIFELGLKGWKHRQIKNAISSTEENKSFYARLAELMSKAGWLDIWVLRLNETSVAFEYHVRYGNKIHALIADFDEDYRDLSPGSVLDFHIMQHIFKNADGCEYDMGCGEAFYKMNWTDKAIKYRRLCIYNNTICAKLFMAIESKVIPYLKIIRDALSERVQHTSYNNTKKKERGSMKNITAVAQDLKNTLKREYCAGRFHALYALVYPTYRCTSRCKTCNIWKRNEESVLQGELGWDEWRKVFMKMNDAGIKTVEIFGGDALLRKDLVYNMIRFCSQNGIATYFPTNSSSLDKKTAERLVAAGLDTIYFSLDDVSSSHDTIRGKNGAFTQVQNAIENIARVKKNGKPHIVICTTISNMNYQHLADIMDFLRRYPVDAMYPRIMEEYSEYNINNSIVNGIKPEPYFTASDGVSHLLNDNEVNDFRYIIRKMKLDARLNGIYVNYRGVDMVADEVFTKGIHAFQRCLVCSTLVTIDPMGNVFPCPMYNKYHMGNLLHCSLEDIWGNEKHRQFVKYQREMKIKICESCSLREYYPTISRTLMYYYKRAVEKAASRLFPVV